MKLSEATEQQLIAELQQRRLNRLKNFSKAPFVKLDKTIITSDTSFYVVHINDGAEGFDYLVIGERVDHTEAEILAKSEYLSVVEEDGLDPYVEDITIEQYGRYGITILTK